MNKTKVPTFKFIWISFIALLSLNACSTVSGNVVPKSGPKMEKVYDSMQTEESSDEDGSSTRFLDKNLNDIQIGIARQIPKPSEYNFKKYQKSGLKDFKKLPNPEITLYVYPHFAGQEQMPVPGYFTRFNVYERDYYSLLI